MFRQLASASEVVRTLLDRCEPVGRKELIPIAEARGRVISEDVVSPVDLPGFSRAAMDGYAVRAEETRGAGPLAPIYMGVGNVVGENTCVPVRTGAPIPDGADAVVMKEDVVLRGDRVEITAEVHPNRNLARVGEDAALGEAIFWEGHRLRPPDIALLAALGLCDVEVYQVPRVAIIPTGGELVPSCSGRSLKPGQAYEINGLMAELYARAWSCSPERSAIVGDDPGLIEEAIGSNLDADLILLIGGTSVGEMDHAPRVLSDLGELVVHGVRITPGKPTAAGFVGNVPVVCLPGYPVAALAALYLFARPLIMKLAHRRDEPRRVKARLSRKIVSRPGYLSFTRVTLKGDVAVPVMTSGAGILSSVTRAQGYVLVPEEMEGIEAGDEVELTLIE